MTATNPRADAYAAALTGIVDAHIAARVLSGPPSWRSPAVDVALTVVCGALALTSNSTPYLAAFSGASCVSCAVEAVLSIRAYRLARRRYLDAVREVADAYARLHGRGDDHG
jgi:hypothetical protein